MVAKTYSHACVNVCGLFAQVYYFNTLTNESRWDTPPGWSEDMTWLPKHTHMLASTFVVF